jgi:tetratricopeptide (TPR) repeat protein
MVADRPHNMRRLAVFLLVFAASLSAEQGVLALTAKDIHERAIKGLQLQAEGSAVSAPTDDSGLARIRLSPLTKQGTWLVIRLVKPKKDWVFISPWDGRVLVPPFDSATEVPIVLVTRGDRAVLENGSAISSLTATVMKKIHQDVTEEPADDTRRALAEVSRAYGLGPEELDKAIRWWGKRTVDPYEKGLADLYEKHYLEATSQLQSSLSMWEDNLNAAQEKVADRAFYLGQSLFAQGRYRESVVALEKTAKFRGDDSIVQNNLGVALTLNGDYSRAETVLRNALVMTENLAGLLQARGDYADAELLYRRALVTTETALGIDDPLTAESLDNLAVLLKDKGDYAAAGPLYCRALVIDEMSLGPDDPDTATSLNNWAMFLRTLGNYAAAEPLFRRVLAIREHVLGPDHPSTATSLNNLGSLLQAKGDYADVEPLYRRALAIKEKVLGPDHPSTATSLNNLGGLLLRNGSFAEAERFFRRAVAIREQALGPDHPLTIQAQSNLAGALFAEKDYATAESLLRDAVAKCERTLGHDHPMSQNLRNSLKAVQGTLAK